MTERCDRETPDADDVLVIETETSTCHVRAVRGCPGIYAVVADGAYVGGFRCDDSAESAIRDEAELVLDEVRVVTGI